MSSARGAGEAAFKHHTQAAETQYYRIVDLVCPYMRDGGQQRNAGDALMAAWEREFGSMTDPDTQEKIASTIKLMKGSVQ